MKYLLLLVLTTSFISCTRPHRPYPSNTQKVWGNRPVYVSKTDGQQIYYEQHKYPVLRPGNIYAFGHYIFQVDVDRGIHVIDNSEPSKADRIGFITVRGCEQISIKGFHLYTNSYADLVTLNISDPSRVTVESRVPDAFPDIYPQPEESGYYECPRPDSLVTGWVKDSVYTNCYKN